MLWLHGRNSNGKGMACPTCQVPEGYDDEQPGRFLQAWDSGFAGGVLRLQEYKIIGPETSLEKRRSEGNESVEDSGVEHGRRARIMLKLGVKRLPDGRLRKLDT